MYQLVQDGPLPYPPPPIIGQPAGNESAVCWVCGITIKNRAYIGDHMAIFHPKEVMVECNLCHLMFENQSQVVWHLSSDHKIPSFYCTYCDIKFNQESELNEHFSCEHFLQVERRSIKYSCSKRDCSATFNDIRTLRLHEDQMHNILIDCSICGSKLARHQLDNHMKNYHYKKTYKCFKCDKTFQTGAHLQTHIKSIHFNIRYQCNLCGYKYMSKLGLDNHIDTCLLFR